MDINLKLKQRLNMFEDIDKLANYPLTTYSTNYKPKNLTNQKINNKNLNQNNQTSYNSYSTNRKILNDKIKFESNEIKNSPNFNLKKTQSLNNSILSPHCYNYSTVDLDNSKKYSENSNLFSPLNEKFINPEISNNSNFLSIKNSYNINNNNISKISYQKNQDISKLTVNNNTKTMNNSTISINADKFDHNPRLEKCKNLTSQNFPYHTDKNHIFRNYSNINDKHKKILEDNKKQVNLINNPNNYNNINTNQDNNIEKFKNFADLNSNFQKNPQKNNTLIYDRLYNFSTFYNDKIIQTRNIQNFSRLRSATPEITKKASEIIRNQNLFHYRLYPYHKINNKNKFQNNCDSTLEDQDIEQNIKNKIVKIEGIDDIQTFKIYRTSRNKTTSNHNNFSFSPVLNSKSLKIAEKLEDVKIRLVQKKKEYKNFNIKNNSNNFSNNLENISENSNSEFKNTFLSKKVHSHSFDFYLNNIRSNKNKSFSPLHKKKKLKDITRPLDLYKKGLENIKKKEAKSLEKIFNDSQSYKLFSYKPKISKKIFQSYLRGRPVQLNYSTISPENKNSENKFYEKHLIWKNNVERKIKKIKENQDENNKKLYTYKPDIIRQEMPNDEKFIERNLNQIQDYVNKRRANIQKNLEEEKFKMTKFHYGENYKNSPTIPKEFNLSKNGSKEKSNSKSRMKNEIYTSHSLKNLRNKFGTQEFFYKENPQIHIHAYNHEINSINSEGEYFYNKNFQNNTIQCENKGNDRDDNQYYKNDYNRENMDFSYYENINNFNNNFQPNKNMGKFTFNNDETKDNERNKIYNNKKNNSAKLFNGLGGKNSKEKSSDKNRVYNTSKFPNYRVAKGIKEKNKSFSNLENIKIFQCEYNKENDSNLSCITAEKNENLQNQRTFKSM